MPHWEYTVKVGDVWKDEALTFEQRRDAIAGRLDTSRWMADSGPESDLASLVEDLRTAPDVEKFDTTWGHIYDEADADRAWIDIW